MPVSDGAQTSFLAGELSKRLRGRFDTPHYKVGLDYCENFAILPHGGLRSRWGTTYELGLAANPDVRLDRFRVPGAQDLCIELGDHALSLYNEAGAVQFTDSNVEFVRNGDLAEGALRDVGDLAGGPLLRMVYDIGWTPTRGTVWFPGSWMNLTGDVSASVERTDRSIGLKSGAVQQVVFLPAGSLVLAFDYYCTGDSLRVRVGTTPGGGEVYSSDFAPTGGPGAVWASRAVAVTSPGAGAYYLTFDQWTNNDSVGTGTRNVSLSLVFPTYVLPTPWTPAQAGGVCVVSETGKKRAFFFHGNVQPFSLGVNAAGRWVFAPLAFMGQPAEWTGTNWPAVAEIHQGRLWCAATPSEGNAFWASKSGDLFNFTLGQNAGDALSYKIATKGLIRWLRGRKGMLVGTDVAEYAITANGQVVSVSDIDVHDESAFGSCDGINAVNIGTEVLYLSGDRRKVHGISFANDSQAWESHDVTFIAEHITDGGVKELHFARDPDANIVLVMQDGTVRCCTYNRTDQVSAWWRVTTDGDVLSAAVSDGPAGSIVYLAVQRTGGIYLERMTMREGGQPVLDSHKVIAGPIVAGTPLAGLGHLEGETVQVVVDGGIADEQVVAGGAIVPSLSGAVAHVGLGYTQKAITLPAEGGNPRGTAQSSRRRNVKVIALLNDSAKPLIGGERAAELDPATPMDTAQPRFTGEVEARGLGWDDRGMVTIEQDLPLRTEILALYGSRAVNGV